MSRRLRRRSRVKCDNLTVCATDEYESRGSTETSDRECTQITDCASLSCSVVDTNQPCFFGFKFASKKYNECAVHSERFDGKAWCYTSLDAKLPGVCSCEPFEAAPPTKTSDRQCRFASPCGKR